MYRKKIQYAYTNSKKSRVEKEMATHSSVLAWGIPMDRGAWQATVHRVTKSWTRLKQ